MMVKIKSVVKPTQRNHLTTNKKIEKDNPNDKELLKDPLTANEVEEESVLNGKDQRLPNDSFEVDEDSGLVICSKLCCDEKSIWTIIDWILLDKALEDKNKKLRNESFTVDEEEWFMTEDRILWSKADEKTNLKKFRAEMMGSYQVSKTWLSLLKIAINMIIL